MPVIVQKYGGSSVADVEKIKKIAEIIAAVKKTGYDVVAVVSAMGKTTNQLIELAKSLSNDPAKRELDMLLSTGERVSMALLCIALNELGFKAISLTGSQSGIITNDRYNDARVIEVRPFRVQDELAKGMVVVIGGFQGVSYKRDITTLGRGGSDTSAIAMAAALNAERCEIYSDVDGVYTADPKLIKEARHLPELAFQQLQEMSEAGAKVMNAQAVQFAKESKIAIYARSTFQPGKETVIREARPTGKTSVIAVVHESEIIRIIYNGKNNNDIRVVLDYLEKKEIAVKELNLLPGINNESHLSFVISKNNIHSWEKIKGELINNFKDQLSIDESLSAVSLIGEGFSRDNRIITETLNVLSGNDIDICGLTTTSFRISVLIRKVFVEKAVTLLHNYWI